MKSRVLIVDDERSLLDFLHVLLEGEGLTAHRAASVREARAKLNEQDFDLVVSDILMPDGNGLELLREIKDRRPETAVIMMTAYASDKSAVEAMRLGAYNYLTKPFDNEELKILVQGALEKSDLEVRNVELQRELESKYRSQIIGKSARMKEVFALIDRVARTHSTVQIWGESGTGKELIARAIHFSSPRAGNRFLSINCGAMPENLLESELFGHEKGAFTGATREKKGLFQEAHQGTLFLDEVGEMSPTMQVKLLRVLQDKKVRRVGGNAEEPVDVRIIAATNRDLKERIETGDFREDLYYRINVIPIELPPLRQRRSDISLLAKFFIQKYSREMDIEPKPLEKTTLEILEGYDWPGNVRELENTIERALALSIGDQISVADLPFHIVDAKSSTLELAQLPPEGIDLEKFLDDLRREMMIQALERTSGVQKQAADLLEMTFRSFRYYAKKLQLFSGDETGDYSDDTVVEAGSEE